MKMKKMFFVSLAIVFLSGPAAEACSCAPPVGVEMEFARSDAVFVGRVVGIEARHGVVARFFLGVSSLVGLLQEPPPGYYDVIATFQVTEAFKVPTPGRLRISTPDPDVCCICGYRFEVGKEYLVYARGPGLTTSICSRTRPNDDPAADLRRLRVLAAKRSGNYEVRQARERD